MDKNFGNVIWTNHVLSRLKQRKISQSDAWATWKRPDSSRYSKTKGAWIYQRKIGNKAIEVVAKKNEKQEWIIISVWSRQSFGGSGNFSGKISPRQSFIFYLIFFFLVLIVLSFLVLSFLE